MLVREQEGQFGSCTVTLLAAQAMMLNYLHPNLFTVNSPTTDLDLLAAAKAMMQPSSILSKGFRKKQLRRTLKKKLSQAADDSYAGTEGYLTD